MDANIIGPNNPQNRTTGTWENFLVAQQHRKRKRNLILIVVSCIVIILAVIFFSFTAARNKAFARTSAQIQNYLDGKLYIVGDQNDSYMTLYAFREGTMAFELWHFDSVTTEGDITAFAKYKIDPSSIGDAVILFGAGNRLVVSIDSSGSVQPASSSWSEATPEEIVALKTKYMCEHVFGPSVRITAATCTQEGTAKQTCNKCGTEQIVSTDLLPHNYVNKICSSCGQKKPAEKSAIAPNTWYTYQGVLHFQNIKLQNAFSVSQGKGMLVSYYFVCQHCHGVDETLRQNVPEFNYSINKMFTCEECEELTVVKIELG